MNYKFKWLTILAGLVLLGFGMILMLKIPALGLTEAKFCGQCHAMDEQVDTYLHSSHADVANCGDCHDPHALVSGSMFAAYTGTRDVYRVVTNTAPAVIRTTSLTKQVLQENCLRCHGDIMGDIGDTSKNGGTKCIQCHQNVAHLKK